MEIYLFKNTDPKEFEKAFEDAVAATRGGSVLWNVPKNRHEQMIRDYAIGWLCTKGGVTSLLLRAPCDDVMCAISKSISGPRLTVLFQEKSFWEFSLDNDQELVINFSTAPGQWGEFDPRDYPGTPDDLSKIWGVPVDRIERYMVDWGLTEVWVEKFKTMSTAYKMSGSKAYPDDEFGYGNLYQGYDFVKALGGTIPPRDGKCFFVDLPPPQRTTK
jgi:hypothetical protein